MSEKCGSGAEGVDRQRENRDMIANLPSRDVMKQKRDDAEENQEGSLKEENHKEKKIRKSAVMEPKKNEKGSAYH